MESIPLWPYLEILEDPTLKLSIDQVSGSRQSSDFSPVPHNRYRLDDANSAYWLRFKVKNRSERHREWWLVNRAFWSDHSDLYVSRPGGGWVERKNGVMLPISSKEIKTHLSVESIDLLPGEEREIYLRLTGTDVFVWLEIQTPSVYYGLSNQFVLFNGLFMGLVIVMVLYNGFLAISLRSIDYLYYIFYIFFYALYVLSHVGFSYQYFWPDLPELNKRIDIVFSGLGYLGIVFFTTHFLKVKINAPRLGRFLWLSLGIYLSVLLGYLFSATPFFLTLVIQASLLMSLALTSVIGRIWLLSYRPARYYMAAYIALLAGYLVKYLDFIFTFIPIEWLDWSMHLGGAVEITLFSVALADRINLLNSEKQKIQDKLDVTNKELLKMDKIKDDFLAKVTHELRTPLHGILGIVRSLKDRYTKADENEVIRNLDLVEYSGERLSHLVDEILDFKQIQHQGLKLALKPIDLASMVDSIYSHFYMRLNSKPIETLCEIPPGFPFVMADEKRLQQILFNLIDNAVKFTDHGQISVQAKVITTKVLVSVTDTGIGISKEDQTRIFEPYQQAKKPSDQYSKGAGLGLSLAKNLVELHGGTLGISSSIREGSHFFFDLPLAQVEAESIPADIPRSETRTENIPSESLSKDRPVILIVDDDPINLEVIKLYLKDLDYKIIEASGGDQALKMVDKIPPDLILLDIIMPLISGFEVCRLLRLKHTASKLPIIFLTAKNQVKDITEGYSLGGNDYIYKPFTKDEILPKIDDQLKRKSFRSRYDPPDYSDTKISDRV
ncbi:MAG: response regulator [Deltaproteobacteria bacterium]|nr:response regulator [Deltaproteobacteria bacterium]